VVVWFMLLYVGSRRRAALSFVLRAVAVLIPSHLIAACNMLPDVGGVLEYESASSNTLVYNGGRSLSKRRKPLDVNGQNAWNVFNNTKVSLCGRGILDWGVRSEWFGTEFQDLRDHSAHVFGDVWFDDGWVECRTQNSFEDVGSKWMERLYNMNKYKAFRSCTSPHRCAGVDSPGCAGVVWGVSCRGGRWFPHMSHSTLYVTVSLRRHRKSAHRHQLDGCRMQPRVGACVDPPCWRELAPVPNCHGTQRL